MKFLAILALPLVVANCAPMGTGSYYMRTHNQFGLYVPQLAYNEEARNLQLHAAYNAPQPPSYAPAVYTPTQPTRLTPEPTPEPQHTLAQDDAQTIAHGAHMDTPTVGQAESFEALKDRYRKIDPYVIEQYEAKRQTTLDLTEKVYWAAACKVIDPLTASVIFNKLGYAYITSIGSMGVIGLHNADKTIIQDSKEAARTGLQHTDCEVWHDHPDLVQAVRMMAR